MKKHLLSLKMSAYSPIFLFSLILLTCVLFIIPATTQSASISVGNGDYVNTLDECNVTGNTL